MLYEIKEKGSMVIVPSSAVETMGLGGLSGLTALGGGRVPGGSARRLRPLRQRGAEILPRLRFSQVILGIDGKLRAN